MPIVQNAAVFTAGAHDQADRPAVLTTANANHDSDAPPPKSDGKTKGKKIDNGSQIDAAFAEGSRGGRGADSAWDVLMLNAKRQAEEYPQHLVSALAGLVETGKPLLGPSQWLRGICAGAQPGDQKE